MQRVFESEENNMKLFAAVDNLDSKANCILKLRWVALAGLSLLRKKLIEQTTCSTSLKIKQLSRNLVMLTEFNLQSDT